MRKIIKNISLIALCLAFAFSADPNWEDSFDGSAYEFTATLANAQVFIDGQVKTRSSL